MAGEHVDDLGAARGLPRESRSVGGHQDPRRAEPALERVVASKRLLQRRQRALPGERLDRLDLAAVDLHREQAAAAHRHPVDEHRAGAADAVLAADVRAGQAQPMAEEVRQQEPRLDGLLYDAPVDGRFELDHAALSIARVDECARQGAQVASARVQRPAAGRRAARRARPPLPRPRPPATR